MKKQGILEKVANLVYLSIGSNLGNRLLNIEKTKSLILDNNINIITNSSYYETPSWPNPKFPKFLNIVLKLETKLDIKDLFSFLQNVEKIIGRKKDKKNYPRVCDIDIIDYDGKNYSLSTGNKKIISPHPRMHKRNFVLFPLFEVNKNWRHPKSKENIEQLLYKLPIKSIRSIKLK